MDFWASFPLLWDLCFPLWPFSPLKMQAMPNHRETHPQTTESRLTIEKVKQCKGYEHIADEEALFIIQTITSLCQIAVKACSDSQNL